MLIDYNTSAAKKAGYGVIETKKWWKKMSVFQFWEGKKNFNNHCISKRHIKNSTKADSITSQCKNSKKKLQFSSSFVPGGS